MEFSTREFKKTDFSDQEHFLHRMEEKISHLHWHHDGTPVELHPEQKSSSDDDAHLPAEKPGRIVQHGHSPAGDYGTSGSEVSFGCNCGKKWEAIFKGDVIEVNELPINLHGSSGYGPSSSSSHGYGSSGSKKSGYNFDSGYGHSGSSKKNEFYH